MKMHRLTILAVIRAGRVWSGRVRGRLVRMWIEGGKVRVVLPSRKQGERQFDVATVTEALREI